MNTLHTTQLAFDLPLHRHDLDKFRGAVAALVGLDQDLFHNHDNTQSGAYQQRYPLVQYRIFKGHASILGINAGATALEEFAEAGLFREFCFQGQKLPLALAGYQRDPEFSLTVKRRTEAYTYRVTDYLPFSQERHREYQQTKALRPRMALLERMLRNHIVAFAWGVGWQLPQDRRITVRLEDIEREDRRVLKDQPYTAFDLVFSTNARLPEGIGLGRKTAFGCGEVQPAELD